VVKWRYVRAATVEANLPARGATAPGASERAKTKSHARPATARAVPYATPATAPAKNGKRRTRRRSEPRGKLRFSEFNLTVAPSTAELGRSAAETRWEQHIPSPQTTDLPRAKSWDEFENIGADVLKLVWEDQNIVLNGQLGQGQKGVDCYTAYPEHLGGAAAKKYANAQSRRRW